ncbi:MAG: hypothetical protein QXI52_03565 [Nitrososphaerota archaeon]
MSNVTFSGYIEGIQATRIGKAISLKIRLITPGGQRTELFIHNPPDWLNIGKAIKGTYYEAETPDGSIHIIDSIQEDKTLKSPIIQELTLEKILSIGQDTVVVEGRHSDGRIFSYTLKDPKFLEFKRRLPLTSLGLFIERGSLQVLLTIISKAEYSIISRTCEISSHLSKIAMEEPEKKFLEGE